MARYRGASWRPVDRYQSGSLHVPMKARRGVGHTAVTSSTPSMHGFFNVDGRATPHFYVGRRGELEQYIDTGYRASACLEGNVDCIAFESWDGFGGSWNGQGPGPRFADDQAETIAGLMVWCHRVHGIPLRRLRTSRLGGTGWGWHRLGIDGNFSSRPLLRGRVRLGQHWSLSFGKTCPTDTRILQMNNEILPRARQLDATEEGDPAVTKNRAEQALTLLHQAIGDMKPSPRRALLQRAARLIRRALPKEK